MEMGFQLVVRSYTDAPTFLKRVEESETVEMGLHKISIIHHIDREKHPP